MSNNKIHLTGKKTCELLWLINVEVLQDTLLNKAISTMQHQNDDAIPSLDYKVILKLTLARLELGGSADHNSLRFVAV